eukprot:PhM_4_TR8767/c0_g1_i1/m.37103
MSTMGCGASEMKSHTPANDDDAPEAASQPQFPLRLSALDQILPPIHTRTLHCFFAPNIKSEEQWKSVVSVKLKDSLMKYLDKYLPTLSKGRIVRLNTEPFNGSLCIEENNPTTSHVENVVWRTSTITDWAVPSDSLRSGVIDSWPIDRLGLADDEKEKKSSSPGECPAALRIKATFISQSTHVVFCIESYHSVMDMSSIQLLLSQWSEMHRNNADDLCATTTTTTTPAVHTPSLIDSLFEKKKDEKDDGIKTPPSCAGFLSFAAMAQLRGTPNDPFCFEEPVHTVRFRVTESALTSLHRKVLQDIQTDDAKVILTDKRPVSMNDVLMAHVWHRVAKANASNVKDPLKQLPAFLSVPVNVRGRKYTEDSVVLVPHNYFGNGIYDAVVSMPSYADLCDGTSFLQIVAAVHNCVTNAMQTDFLRNTILWEKHVRPVPREGGFHFPGPNTSVYSSWMSHGQAMHMSFGSDFVTDGDEGGCLLVTPCPATALPNGAFFVPPPPLSLLATCDDKPHTDVVITLLESNLNALKEDKESVMAYLGKIV